MFAAVIAAGCLAVLGLAAWLRPDAAGHGTHTQLGLPPCTWATALGEPCPTCGMTTSFAFAAHGDLGRSFIAQPFGAVLAIGAAATFWGALHVLLTGSCLGRMAGRMFMPRPLLVLGGAALAAWAYKLVTWPG